MERNVGSNEVKRYYYQLVNHEFRQLQLDKNLRNKLVFDLIDYCELLYENSYNSTMGDEKALKFYIRGFLIFNYFINSFIMVHFKGFDQFIKNNEYDFIIYLNVFAFYSTDEVIDKKQYRLPLRDLRQLVIDYLVDRQLLKFDVEELYEWLNKYIDYLKKKDKHHSHSDAESSSSVSSEEKTFADDYDTFKSRYPSVKLSNNDNKGLQRAQTDIMTLPKQPEIEIVKKTLDPNHSSAAIKRPPIPTQLPPGLPSTPYPTKDITTTSILFPVDNDAKNSPPRSTGTSLQRPPMSKPYSSPHVMIPHLPARAMTVPTNGTFIPQSPVHQVPLPPSNQMYYPQYYQQSYQPPYQQPYQQQFPQSIPPTNHQNMQDFSICGLKNFGSSCYINSTVQVIFGINEFKQLFSNSTYTHYIRTPKYLQMLKDPHKNSNQNVLLCEGISGLLKSFKLHGGASIAPTKFIRISSLLKPDFNIPYEQQDSQEFLLFLLERLHEELMFKENGLSLAEFYGFMNEWKINIPDQDLDGYLKWYNQLIEHEGTSPIHDLFQGHLQNKLICNNCKYQSINYSPFTILSLPIPSSGTDTVDLSDCLRYYSQDELLSGDNAWKCPKCTSNVPNDNLLDNHPVFTKKSGIFKFSRRAKSPSRSSSKSPSKSLITTSTKTLNFIKLPKILFIHLSRFSIFNLTDKLNTNILYPIYLKFNNYSNDITYKLTGLINHYGNLKSGHYTALVNKSDDYWCYFDDENVRLNLAHGVNLQSRDIYVLCYERI